MCVCVMRLVTIILLVFIDSEYLFSEEVTFLGNLFPKDFSFTSFQFQCNTESYGSYIVYYKTIIIYLKYHANIAKCTDMPGGSSPPLPQVQPPSLRPICFFSFFVWDQNIQFWCSPYVRVLSIDNHRLKK